MKSILISIQPKWCELIASGKKTIEVRKTRPKIDVPFKVYIYCTKGKYFLYKNPNNGELFLDCNGRYRGGDYEDRFLSSKVIGEFVCDRITEIVCWDDTKETNIDETLTCLTYEEIEKYGNGKLLYGWHITDVKIYDKPKELGEFIDLFGEYSDLWLFCDDELGTDTDTLYSWYAKFGFVPTKERISEYNVTHKRQATRHIGI